MKRNIIAWTLLLTFFYVPYVFAEEYRFDKSCNPEILVQELKEAGINLLGKDQVGYLKTSEGKIIVITHENIDENILTNVINNHDYKTLTELEKEQEKIERERTKATKIKVKSLLKEVLKSVDGIGATDEEIEILFE